MKNSINILFVLAIIFLSSCKKEETEIIPLNNKQNFVLLDKTVTVNGLLCNQYLNSSTGQIVYKEVYGNSTKVQTYDLRAYYAYVANEGMTIVCNGFGNTCRTGTVCIGGKSVDVIIVKPEVEIK